MKLFNRVGFATPTIGTDNLAIGAAIRSATDGDYLTPAEAGAVDGDQSPYFIIDGHSFAQGLGTYSATGPTLVRDPAERRWNGTTEAAGKLALSGNAVVFISPRAADILQAAGITTNGVLFAGDAGVAVTDGTNFVWDAVNKVLSVVLLRISSTALARGDNTNGFNLYGGVAGTECGRIGLYGAEHPTNPGLLHLDGNNLRFRSATGVEWARFVDSRFGILEAAPDYNLDVNGTFGFRPGTAVTPVDNGDVTFSTPSNSQLSVHHKGSDGTVRTGAFQLSSAGVVHVGRDTTDTLLNKTLTAPILTDAKNRTTPRIVSGTSDTLVLADEGKRIETTNGSATTITVPPNSSVAFAVNAEIDLLQVGAGQVTVVAGAGVTINGTPGLKLRAQWSAATLIKRATDTWVLVGDLSA